MADEFDAIEQEAVTPELFTEDEPLDDVEEAFERSEEAVDGEDLVVTIEPGPTPLGRSWAFDFTTKRFVMAGHQPIETRREQTLRYWIEKCLRTPQGGAVIEPPEYGLDAPANIFGDQFDSADVATREERIREALLFHPAITGIDGYEAAPDPEDEEVLLESFRVILDDSTTLDMNREVTL
jgi:hypothetical protein